MQKYSHLEHGCTGEEALLRHLAYQASAVIQKAKPAELVTLKNTGRYRISTFKEYKPKLMAALRVACFELRERDDSISLLFYSGQLLPKMLSMLSDNPLLRKYAYPVGGTCRDMLCHLARRFSGEDFPHEVGLFLGYPQQDVTAFAEGRRDHCFCGYWKVYGNPGKAMELMNRIEQARRRAAFLLSRWETESAVSLLRSNIS